MGVMACARPMCPEILCDVYISDIGYLCNYCREELRGLSMSWPRNLVAREVHKRIAEFADTEAPNRDKLGGDDETTRNLNFWLSRDT